jgi:hypothetical protein
MFDVVAKPAIRDDGINEKSSAIGSCIAQPHCAPPIATQVRIRLYLQILQRMAADSVSGHKNFRLGPNSFQAPSVLSRWNRS